MELFTDNWDNPPVLYEGERLYRIVTDNPCDNLLAVCPADMGEDDLIDEIRWALIRKYGKRGKAIMFGFEDVTDLYYRNEPEPLDYDERTGETLYRVRFPLTYDYLHMVVTDDGDELIPLDWYESTKVWTFDDFSDTCTQWVTPEQFAIITEA